MLERTNIQSNIKGCNWQNQTAGDSKGLTFQYLFKKENQRKIKEMDRIYIKDITNYKPITNLLGFQFQVVGKKYFKQRNISGMIAIYIMFQIR